MNRNILYKIKDNIKRIVLLAGIIAGASYIVGRNSPRLNYSPDSRAELVFSDVVVQERDKGKESPLEQNAKDVQIEQAGFK